MIINYIGAAAGISAAIFVNSGKGKKLVQSDKVRLVVTLVASAASVFFAYRESKNITNYFRNQKFNSELTNGNNPTGTGTQINPDTGQPEQVDVKTIAAKIHDAFYNNDWFGASEDEEAAIAALLMITPTDAHRLATVYNQLYAKVLKEDFISFLSVEQSNGIQAYLNVM
jgi:hypothetical protein